MQLKKFMPQTTTKTKHIPTYYRTTEAKTPNKKGQRVTSRMIVTSCSPQHHSDLHDEILQ